MPIKSPAKYPKGKAETSLDNPYLANYDRLFGRKYVVIYFPFALLPRLIARVGIEFSKQKKKRNSKLKLKKYISASPQRKLQNFHML